METMWQDVRYGVRSLLRSPGFTVVALLTLALGIGANTAIFSVIHGVLLRPLPYEEPEELVQITERSATGGTMSVAWANFRDWRESAGSYEAMAAYGVGPTTVLGGTAPVRAPVAGVTRDFWRVLPVTPVQGRVTAPADHEEGAAGVAVVREDLARELLGQGEVLGRTLEVRGNRLEVVGVLPADFGFPGDAQLWTPIPPQGESRTAHNWTVVARLADGVAMERAGQEVDAIMRRIAARVAGGEDDRYLAVGTRTVGLREVLVGDARQPLFLLLGAAGLVLLVACTNLASMLLARGSSRDRELAVRTALGAPRGRIVRQLLTESMVLAVGGAGLGLAVAAGALHLLRELGSAFVPRMEGVAMDGTVLGFTLAVAVLTALLFGLLPSLRSGRRSQSQTLRGGSRGNQGPGGRSWDLLVATEVALALMLLVGSGLLIRSFARVLAEDAGFHAADVAATPVALSGIRYPELDDHARFWDGLLARVEGMGEVSAAGVVSNRPVAGFAPNGRVALDGDPSKHGDGVYVVASAGAFEALDVPLLQGRLFTERDDADAPHVVVVSRSFAETWWPGEDPVGKQVSGGGMDDYWDAEPTVFGTVVGVVGDVRYRSLTRAGEPTVYWHYKQRPFRLRFGGTLLAEAAGGDPVALQAPLRAVLREADPDVAVRIRPLSALVSDSVADRRFTLWILGSFAFLALLLAAVGIYGVVSYAVARRTREMGIRLALGASPGTVRSLVLGGALRPVAVGLVLGVAASLALTRALGSMLYRVEATDPVTFVAVTVLLLAVGLLASWVPAARSTRVDPLVTMRAE